jgi:hypothetical protein
LRGSCRRLTGPHPENALCRLVLSHHHGFHVAVAQHHLGSAKRCRLVTMRPGTVIFSRRPRKRRKSGSKLTPCWREMDSNPRSPVTGPKLFRGCRRLTSLSLAAARAAPSFSGRPAATAGRGSAAASERAHGRRPRKRRRSGASDRPNHIRADRCWALTCRAVEFSIHWSG